MSETRLALPHLSLCEATCGLQLSLDGDRITHVRGDRDHVVGAIPNR